MNFRKGSARRIKPPEQMDHGIVKAAEAILADGPDAIDLTHTEEALERVIDQTTHLADYLTGEARLRCLMAVQCLLDCQDEFLQRLEGEDE